MTLDERFNLQGKVTAVIGGAGHLCSTLATAMSDAGMTVFILDTSEPRASGDPTNARMIPYLHCDVTSRADLLACRNEILRRHGRVDVLLLGAGANAPTPVFDVSQAEFEHVVGVHLTGAFQSCQVFGETMVAQRAGSIIHFASVSSGPPLSKAFAYSAAKAGVVSIMQNLAREWAPHNVRVNALRPGFFPTEWSMKHFIDEERKTKILAHTPMGRFGQPEELVGAVLWLASDASSFVTGSIITVDGGFTAMTI